LKSTLSVCDSHRRNPFLGSFPQSAIPLGRIRGQRSVRGSLSVRATIAIARTLPGGGKKPPPSSSTNSLATVMAVGDPRLSGWLEGEFRLLRQDLGVVAKNPVPACPPAITNFMLPGQASPYPTSTIFWRHLPVTRRTATIATNWESPGTSLC